MAANNYRRIVSNLVSDLLHDVANLHKKFNEKLVAANVVYSNRGLQYTFKPDDDDFETFKDGKSYITKVSPTMTKIPMYEFCDVLGMGAAEIKDSFICQEELDKFIESGYAKKRAAWLKKQPKMDPIEKAKKIAKLNDAIARLKAQLDELEYE